MSGLLRLYTAEECGRDGYPPEWHDIPGVMLPLDEYGLTRPFGIKHLVHADAGHRCVRCLHPYRNGEHGTGEWSPCDDRCIHSGPMRVWCRTGAGEDWEPFDPTPGRAAHR